MGGMPSGVIILRFIWAPCVNQNMQGESTKKKKT
jgi:hypothetical protein